MAQSTPQGWYPDPQSPELLRYWDGAQWTGRTSADDTAAPPTPQPVQPLQAVESEHIPVFGARKLAEELQRENHELKRENQELKRQNQGLRRENQELKAVVDRTGAMSLIDVEAETKRLTTELDRLRAEKTDLQTALETEKSKLEKEIQQASSELVETQGLVQMQDVGLYQYQQPAESSVALRGELDSCSGTDQGVRPIHGSDFGEPQLHLQQLCRPGPQVRRRDVANHAACVQRRG
jgi:hypothetical protein